MKNRLVPVVLLAMLACLFGHLAVGQTAELSTSAQAAEPLRIVSLPYLQNPSPDSMKVMWETNQPCVGWVEYGEGASLDQKAVGSHHGLIDANEAFCKVPLTGLKPGTSYSYRAVSKAILKFNPYEVTFGETTASETYSFTTPGPNRESVTFVSFNDLHASKKLRDLLFPIAKQAPFDLAFFNGDLMSSVNSREHAVNHLVVPGAELCGGTVPFILVRGNHETRGSYARKLMDVVATPDNRYYFSFDWGPVHFVVLDSGEDKPDSDKEYSGLVDFDRYRDEETAWLKQEVASEAFARAPFRVAFMHMPLFGGGYGQQDCTKKWAELLNAGNVDLLVSGHTHKHEIVEPQPGVHAYPIIIGGGSEPGSATVIRVTATRDQLDVTMTGDNGETLATRQVKRRGE
ncbi:MAG: FN3 domain-containing metallophosphoesterase family protein [Candidatus Hydrogenedentales bacterium]